MTHLMKTKSREYLMRNAFINSTRAFNRLTQKLVFQPHSGDLRI
jgi:hypothetical protein